MHSEEKGVATYPLHPNHLEKSRPQIGAKGFELRQNQENFDIYCRNGLLILRFRCFLAFTSDLYRPNRYFCLFRKAGKAVQFCRLDILQPGMTSYDMQPKILVILMRCRCILDNFCDWRARLYGEHWPVSLPRRSPFSRKRRSLLWDIPARGIRRTCLIAHIITCW